MSIARRGFLSGLAGILAVPKTLVRERAAGIPAARLLSMKKIVGVSNTVPVLFSSGASYAPKNINSNNLNLLKEINSGVYPKVTQSKVFIKKDLEVFENSEDTSTIYCYFGVSIYADPSGIIVREK